MKQVYKEGEIHWFIGFSINNNFISNYMIINWSFKLFFKQKKPKQYLRFPACLCFLSRFSECFGQKTEDEHFMTFYTLLIEDFLTKIRYNKENINQYHKHISFHIRYFLLCKFLKLKTCDWLYIPLKFDWNYFGLKGFFFRLIKRQISLINNRTDQLVIRSAVTVVGVVAPRLPGAQQRNNVRLLLVLLRGLAGLSRSRPAVNGELRVGLQDARVPAAPAAQQLALRGSVRREAHQGQVTVRLIAARSPAALRVWHLRDPAQAPRSGVQRGRVQTLTRTCGPVPGAVLGHTGPRQDAQDQDAETQTHRFTPEQQLQLKQKLYEFK